MLDDIEKKKPCISRNTSFGLGLLLAGLAMAAYSIYLKPGSPNNQTAVRMEELEKLQQEDAIRREELMPVRSKLEAGELIELADCATVACVEIYMKEKSRDFFYAKKGEFIARQRAVVPDSAGIEMLLPLSTLYMAVHPQASWKLAHTLHSKPLADTLLKEFEQLGFQFTDKRHNSGAGGNAYRYASPQYPGISLLITATYNPWGFRGLYENKVSWPCYMFEVYRVE